MEEGLGTGHQGLEPRRGLGCRVMFPELAVPTDWGGPDIGARVGDFPLAELGSTRREAGWEKQKEMIRSLCPELAK